jgi:hypothetical protein
MSEAKPPFPTRLYGAVNMRLNLLGNAVLRVYRMLNYGQQVEKQLVQSQAGIMNKFMYVSTIQPVKSSTGKLTQNILRPKHLISIHSTLGETATFVQTTE